MSEIKKVSDEQLAELQDIQDQFDILTKRYGEIAYEMRAINKAFDELEELRMITIRAVQEAMGASGTVDLATGEFTPD